MNKKQTGAWLLRDLAARHRRRAEELEADADRIEIRRMWREIKPLLDAIWQAGIDESHPRGNARRTPRNLTTRKGR